MRDERQSNERRARHSVLRDRLKVIGPAKELNAELQRWKTDGGPIPYRKLGYGLPFSYYWRTQPTLHDAVRKWRADRVDPDTVEASVARQTEPLKRKLATRLLEALGPSGDNYNAAEAVLLGEYEGLLGQAATNDAVHSFGVELEEIVFPLLHVYRDVARFFREEAIQLDPEGFSPKSAGQMWWRTLKRFGFAALWNPCFRTAFDQAPARLSSEKLVAALALAEQREAHPLEGSPIGKTKGIPKTGRPRKAEPALRLGSLERRIYRDQPKKRRAPK